MMYQEKFVTAVRVAGKILRESGDQVFVPFGSEYSLVLKNKNSLRALVRVEIDGVDATEGCSLIVPANGTVDFERFIKEGNMNEGLRFKFIERTKKIEDGPRGIGAEDGLIRIEFEFEQQKAAYVPGPVYGPPSYPYYPLWNSTGSSPLRGVSYSSNAGGASGSASVGTKSATRSLSDVKLGASGVAKGGRLEGSYADTDGTYADTFTNASVNNASMSFASAMDSAPVNDVGITVGGSVSDQKFNAGAWFPTDGVKHVMVLKLLGQVGEKRVKKAVTVKTKQECPTCGTTNKFGTKFCKECGTGLTIV
jgi:hypothetical protein